MILTRFSLFFQILQFFIKQTELYEDRTGGVCLRLTALAFGSLRGGLCIFFASLRAQTRRKIRIRRAPRRTRGDRFVTTPVPVFLPPRFRVFSPLFVFLFLFLIFLFLHPGSCWRARSSVFRFGIETMKSLSPIAIASRNGRNQRAAVPFSRSFISRSIYKYIDHLFFRYFVPPGLHRGSRGFYCKRDAF